MPTGLTKDAGWELGVRRTVPQALDEVWEHLLGEGLTTWLGRTTLGAVGEDDVTDDGVQGQVRGRTERRRLRLSWRPAGWSHDSTLQLTVLQAASGTAIAFHQERRASTEEREELLAHWRDVVERLAAGLSGPEAGTPS